MSTITWVRGSEMPLETQREACSAFPHRMTFESVRRWPQTARSMGNGGFRLPLISDAAWLAHTLFAVTNKGKLDGRVERCEHDAFNSRVGPVLAPRE